MDDLISELTAQHRSIEARLEAIARARAAGNTALVAAGLAALERELLAHLDREDQALYPPLVGAGSRTNRRSLLLAVRSFSEAATRFAVVARRAVAAGPAGGEDWATLQRTLPERFAREESSLFPLLRSARR